MYSAIEIISIICSSIGAALFIKGVMIEREIIEQMKRIRRPVDWMVQMGLTVFFFVGYIVDIIAIVMHWHDLQTIFMALVFLFGAMFLVGTVHIANRTYKAIFKAAEENLDADLELEN